MILAAGGTWDRIERRFVGPADRAKTIDLNEGGQLDFTRWFAEVIGTLRERRPQKVRLAVAAGDRRGGKTFDTLLCLIAFLIDVPALDGSATSGWVVSASYQELEEIDRTIREYVPSAWYTARRAPHFIYTFANGATLRNVSADDPETLKRGRVDVVLYNEAQKIRLDALINGIYGTADKGGLAILATNPPRRQIGDWVRKLKLAIDGERVSGVKYFGFSSKDNPEIDQAAHLGIDSIIRVLDPKAARVEGEGEWLPTEELAYPKWKPSLIRPAPQLGDITAKVTRDRAWTSYDQVAGADFQGRPHQAAAVVQVFSGPNGPIYCFVDEIITEGTELHLSDEAYDKGYTPESLIFIGDSSGAWQDGKHIKGRASFDVLKEQRWNVLPPQKIKRPDRSDYSKNPDVDDRLGLMYLLMEQERIFVSPGCTWLAESFEKCPITESRHRKHRPFGVHSHITDAAGYAIWWLEPRAKPAPRGPRIGDVQTHDVMPQGPRIL